MNDLLQVVLLSPLREVHFLPVLSTKSMYAPEIVYDAAKLKIVVHERFVKGSFRNLMNNNFFGDTRLDGPFG